VDCCQGLDAGKEDLDAGLVTSPRNKKKGKEETMTMDAQALPRIPFIPDLHVMLR
jgi:hypothetical protein